MEQRAVIIGGSLAGLIHGIMLHREGYAVTILEQASDRREGFDAGISVGPDVVSFLKKYDRIDRPYEIRALGPQFINAEGGLGRKFKLDLSLSSWGLLVSILRANFDGTPSKAVPHVWAGEDHLKKAEYRPGACVKSVEDMGKTINVRFEDVLHHTTESISADIVVVADGSNSSIRKQLIPGVSRQYAGYVSWRGTVRENLIEERHRNVFEGTAVFHLMDRSYILVYLIPTDDGSLEPGERLYNWVWYDHLPEGSKEHSETMTDVKGKMHYGTVPRGLIQPDVWERKRAFGMSKLPPCIAALVEHTPSPFVTKIYDTASTKAVFFGNKLFMVGDALVAFRPHIALSTNQAAYQCQLLEKVINGKMSPREWEHAVLQYGNAKRMYSVVVGTFGVGTRMALMWILCKYIMLLLRQRFGFLS